MIYSQSDGEWQYINRGSSGKGSSGKGSSGKGYYGKGSSGKGYYGKGSIYCTDEEIAKLKLKNYITINGKHILQDDSWIEHSLKNPALREHYDNTNNKYSNIKICYNHCKNGCKFNDDCRFIHPTHIRGIPVNNTSRPKYKVCSNFLLNKYNKLGNNDICPYGDSCRFNHSETIIKGNNVNFQTEENKNLFGKMSQKVYDMIKNKEELINFLSREEGNYNKITIPYYKPENFAVILNIWKNACRLAKAKKQNYFDFVNDPKMQLYATNISHRINK